MENKQNTDVIPRVEDRPGDFGTVRVYHTPPPERPELPFGPIDGDSAGEMVLNVDPNTIAHLEIVQRLGELRDAKKRLGVLPDELAKERLLLEAELAAAGVVPSMESPSRTVEVGTRLGGHVTHALVTVR